MLPLTAALSWLRSRPRYEHRDIGFPNALKRRFVFGGWRSAFVLVLVLVLERSFPSLDLGRPEQEFSRGLSMETPSAKSDPVNFIWQFYR